MKSGKIVSWLTVREACLLPKSAIQRTENASDQKLRGARRTRFGTISERPSAVNCLLFL